MPSEGSQIHEKTNLNNRCCRGGIDDNDGVCGKRSVFSNQKVQDLAAKSYAHYIIFIHKIMPLDT